MKSLLIIFLVPFISLAQQTIAPSHVTIEGHELVVQTIITDHCTQPQLTMSEISDDQNHFTIVDQNESFMCIQLFQERPIEFRFDLTTLPTQDVRKITIEHSTESLIYNRQD